MYAQQAKDADIIITTALIPGKPAPKLITAEMVRSMKPGSVIVDMAAEQGGNCELTEPGQAVVKHGVTIIGYTDLVSRLAKQSSTLYSNNLLRLTEELCKTKDGVIDVNMEDDAIRGLTVIKDGSITWPRAAAEGGGAAGAEGARCPRHRRATGMAQPSRWPRRRWSPCSASARSCSCSSACMRRSASSSHFTVFVLACFVGYMVVWNVTPVAAHAADERDQRHLVDHRHRRAGADRAAAGRRRRRPAERADPRPGVFRAGADGRQHVRRLRGHAAHAGDVPQIRATNMSSSLATVCYIAATILFILSLGGLANPETARRGNLFGIVGMALAVLATVLGPRVTPAGYAWIIGALVVGGSVGLYAAKKVQMTQMPELVALMHSLVGLAACLVGFASYVDTSTVFPTAAEKSIHEIEIYIGILIGAVTFSGSIVAFGKLSGKIGGKPLLLPGRHWMNLAGLLIVIIFGRVFVQADSTGGGMAALLVMTLIALLFGVHMVMAIGGADMPVVVSMLNSYSGWAAAATGFMLSNDLLIVVGALVGRSGAILSATSCAGR